MRPTHTKVFTVCYCERYPIDKTPRSLYLTHYGYEFMEIHDKIRFVRMFRGWSQEKTAEKLGMTLNGYAKIENGKVDIALSRLKNIAEILGVELSQLVGLNDKNILNFIENHDNSRSHHQPLDANSNYLECTHKLEKSQLIIEKLEQEVYYLKEMLESFKSRK